MKRRSRKQPIPTKTPATNAPAFNLQAQVLLTQMVAAAMVSMKALIESVGLVRLNTTRANIAAARTEALRVAERLEAADAIVLRGGVIASNEQAVKLQQLLAQAFATVAVDVGANPDGQ